MEGGPTGRIELARRIILRQSRPCYCRPGREETQGKERPSLLRLLRPLRQLWSCHGACYRPELSVNSLPYLPHQVQQGARTALLFREKVVSSEYRIIPNKPVSMRFPFPLVCLDHPGHTPPSPTLAAVASTLHQPYLISASSLSRCLLRSWGSAVAVAVGGAGAGAA